jgi:hypothetical protein
MRKTLKLVKEISIIVMVIVACATKLHAQTYPVQVNAQITPPFSPYLNDYTEAGAQRFMVNFLLRDPTLPEYRCKLRLTIEGVGITIRTKPGFVPQPLVLPGGGIPLQLYGEDLLEYFNPNNLDFAGITRSQYAKGAKLPDGVYRFTVEVLDYNRGSVVSNKGTTVAWIILNDPPLLNMPRMDTKVKILDPTNIPFTWTPRHTGSPNAAFTTEYIFRLVEIWPATRNAYDAFLSQQPLYEITTNSTQVVYGPAEPALIPGRKYAWQVQAKDVEGRDLFKNQGKSEVFVFQFGDALGAPEGLYLQTANPTSLVVRWEQNVAGTDAVKYRVRYRPHNDRDHDNWYEEESEEQWRALPQLQPDTEYEVQVRAEQNVQVSEYSPVKVFKTALPGANEFVCKSDVTPPPAPATNAPAFRLGVNDTIHAGGYDVLVRELTANANGVYTGSGMAIVPWFMHAKVRVTFKNINVNTQHWLTSGEIKSVWNPDSKFLIKSESKDPTSNPKNGETPVTVAETKRLIEIKDAVIVDVTKNEDGDIEVHTSDGETKKFDKGQSYSIVDDAGNGYIVDKEGNIAKTTAQEARDAAGRGDRNYTITLRFVKGNGVFGFDEKKYDALASNYQQLEDGPFIAWKAVSSRPDVVNAVLEGTDIDPKKVRFEVNGTLVVHSGFNNGPSIVTVQGKAEGTVEELLAVYAPSDTGKVDVLGKLNMVSYDQISRNLVIVPVNDAKLPGSLSDITLTQELTKIYGQAVADWKVSITPTPLKVTLDEYFDDGESGLLSNYTADMKKVINAFGNLQEKTYYLFLVEKPRSGKSALGYMPRSKQAGFIFSDNLTSTNAIPTIAHELGHGAFNLKHIFSEYSFSKGATDNLMDYNNGTTLCKYQWDHVHDPQRVIGLFEDDEDAESVIVYHLPDRLKNNGKYYSFVTPAATRVVFEDKNVKEPVFFHGIPVLEYADVVTGTLMDFLYRVDENSNYIKYSAKISNGYFEGYFDNSNKPFPYAKPSEATERAMIMAIPHAISSEFGHIEQYRIAKFQNVVIDDYQGRNKIVSESDFPRIYADITEQAYDDQDPKKVIGNGQLDISHVEYSIITGIRIPLSPNVSIGLVRAKEALEIANHNGKPEILTMLKIAQWANMYPEYYDEFDIKYRLLHPVSNFDCDINCALEKLKALKEFLVAKHQEHIAFMKQDLSAVSADDLTRMLLKFSESDLNAITVKKRIQIIKTLISSKSDIPDDRELVIVKLTKFIYASKVDSLLSEYEKDALVVKVINGVEDAFLGIFKGNNYAAFINAIVNNIKRTPSYGNNLVSLIKSKDFVDKNIVWRTVDFKVARTLDLGYTRVNPEKIYVDPANGNVSYDIQSFEGIGSISELGFGVTFPQWAFKSNVTGLKPFDPIVFTNLTSISLIDEGSGEPLGTANVVPAIFLKYVVDKKFNDDAMTNAVIVVDLATLLTGPGALLNATTKVRKGWVIFEISNAAGNLAVNTFGSDLKDTAFKEVVDLSNKVMLVYGLGKLGKGSIRTVGEAIEIAENIKPVLSKELATSLVIAVMNVRKELMQLAANGNKSAEAILKMEAQVQKIWVAEKGVDLLAGEVRAFAPSSLNAELNEALDQVALYRKQKGLPEMGLSSESGTVARLKIGDEIYYGANSSMPTYSLPIEFRRELFNELKSKGKLKNLNNLGQAQFLSHAEAEAIVKARLANTKFPEELTILVDRTTCNNCMEYLGELLGHYGIQRLNIFWKKEGGYTYRIVVAK